MMCILAWKLPIRDFLMVFQKIEWILFNTVQFKLGYDDPKTQPLKNEFQECHNDPLISLPYTKTQLRFFSVQYWNPSNIFLYNTVLWKQEWGISVSDGN